jgi:hypothetical protein
MSTTARETSSKVGSSREVDAAISSPLLSSRLVALGGSVKRQRALDVSAYTTRTRLPISTRKQNGGQSELDKCLERVKAQAVVSAARCAAVTADLRQQQAALREAVLAKAEAVTSHADQHVTQQSSDHTVAAPTEHSDELEALTHTGSAHADAYIAGRENDGDHTDPEMRDDDTLPAASSMQEESASIPPHDAEHGVEDDSTPASKHALLHYSAGAHAPPDHNVACSCPVSVVVLCLCGEHRQRRAEVIGQRKAEIIAPPGCCRVDVQRAQHQGCICRPRLQAEVRYEATAEHIDAMRRLTSNGNP